MTNLLQKPHDDQLVTFGSLRDRRELAITDARASYGRLLAIAVANHVLSANDAAALDGVISALGITLDELDADILAVKAAAAARASIIAPEEENRLIEEHRQRLEELAALKKESAEKIKKAEMALVLANQARSKVSDVARAAIETIAAAEKSRPRAFGRW